MNGYETASRQYGPVAGVGAGTNYTSHPGVMGTPRTQQGHLGAVLEEQAGMIARLNQFISELQDRLGPVLTNEKEVNMATPSAALQSPMNSIAATITGHTGVLYEASNRLATLLSQLTV